MDIQIIDWRKRKLCNISISNLPYIKKDLRGIKYTSQKNGVKNVEIFLEPLDEKYHEDCLNLINELNREGYSFSFHGPFRMTNIANNEDINMVRDSLQSYKEAIDICKDYQGEFLVLHSNEHVYNREEAIRLSIENLKLLVDYCLEKGVIPAIENVGVNKNMIFGESEFINLCGSFPKAAVLIDVGHAIANGWNIEKVVSTLGNRIIAYHLHNNDGVADLHKPMNYGVYDFNGFVRLYKKYTPRAKLILEYGNDFEGHIDRGISFLRQAV